MGLSICAQYTKHLAGELIAVAPQAEAEARYGALKSGWGPRRITELATMTAGVTVLSVDAETIEQVAQLRNACRRPASAARRPDGGEE
jgi:predicted nucleic acid-binding protein